MKIDRKILLILALVVSGAILVLYLFSDCILGMFVLTFNKPRLSVSFSYIKLNYQTCKAEVIITVTNTGYVDATNIHSTVEVFNINEAKVTNRHTPYFGDIMAGQSMNTIVDLDITCEKEDEILRVEVTSSEGATGMASTGTIA